MIIRSLVFIAVCCVSPLYANDDWPYWSGNREITWTIHPSLEAGTHINSLGLNAAGAWYPNPPFGDAVPIRVRFDGKLAVLGYLGHLGIPGPGWEAKFQAEFEVGFGADRLFDATFFLPAAPPAEWNVFAHWGRYESIDGTSQFSGGFGFEWAEKFFDARLTYDNDWFGLEFTDEYRTAAVRADFRCRLGENILGWTAGFTLWTGTTRGLGNLTWDYIYDLSGQYGGAYSHGILYAGFSWNGIELEAGYDGEAIRRTIQDTVHWIVNDARVNPLPREDRIYVQLKLWTGNWLY